jgi:ubiquinone/menaquinone biosynthesis C-methylase UbiE
MDEETGAPGPPAQLLYRDLARYYDLIYSSKDYAGEAVRLRQLIARHKRSAGDELLEVACGSGKHLEQLARDYTCTGVDLNEGMLAIARERLPGVRFHRADMATMDLGWQFDVLTCLFSSIGYVKTEGRLRQTIENFARHLRPGGVAIVEPWFTREAYRAGTAHMTTYDGGDVKIARLNVSELAGDVSIMDMHYLVAEARRGVTHFVDRHELGLFATERTLAIMREAGLEAEYREEGLMAGRSLYVATKRAP